MPDLVHMCAAVVVKAYWEAGYWETGCAFCSHGDYPALEQLDFVSRCAVERVQNFAVLSNRYMKESDDAQFHRAIETERREYPTLLGNYPFIDTNWHAYEYWDTCPDRHRVKETREEIANLAYMQTLFQ